MKAWSVSVWTVGEYMALQLLPVIRLEWFPRKLAEAFFCEYPEEKECRVFSIRLEWLFGGIEIGFLRRVAQYGRQN